jgi:isoleucyl-tRNA synthetase
VSPELKREGLMREIIRQVQNARKQAGLNVDDRIRLELVTDSVGLNAAINLFADTIKQEVLAVSLDSQDTFDFDTTVTLEGKPLTIRLIKA